VPGVGYVTTYADVTERKNAERALRDSQDRLRDFAEMGSDWFWEMGPDLTFTYHSPRYFQITGFRPEDKIGTTRTHFVDPASLKVDPEKWSLHIADLQAHRPFRNFEYEFAAQDGRLISVRISGTPLFDESGMFQGYRGIGTDISGIVESARALKVSDEQFHTFVDNLPASVNLKDTQGHYLLINRKHSEMFGFPEQRIVGKVISEFLPERHADDAIDQEREVLQSKDVVTRERRIVIDGNPRSFLITKFPVLDATGAVARIGTIGFDITELKTAEAALVAAKAEAANRSKSNFLAAMSHDLRTPLNAIIGFADVICLQFFGEINDKYQDYAKDIRLSGEHLLALIGDILDVTAIEAGKLELNRDDVDLATITAECAKIVKGEARARDLEMNFDVPANLPPVRADRQAMKKILLNLLTNSLKFTPRGGTVLVTAEIESEHHVISVRDTGIGIPEDRIGSITEPFVRGSNDPYRSQSGAGLGLAIVKSLVSLHEGTLSIMSVTGEGTVVTVSLPRYRD
jgi:PAS domain S-box-containing protein